MVLGEVCVRSLRAVELVGGIIGARGRRVGCWVCYLGSLALRTSVQGVRGIDKEGRGCGEEDVAVERKNSWSVLLFCMLCFVVVQKCIPVVGIESEGSHRWGGDSSKQRGCQLDDFVRSLLL